MSHSPQNRLQPNQGEKKYAKLHLLLKRIRTPQNTWRVSHGVFENRKHPYRVKPLP